MRRPVRPNPFTGLVAPHPQRDSLLRAIRSYRGRAAYFRGKRRHPEAMQCERAAAALVDLLLERVADWLL